MNLSDPASCVNTSGGCFCENHMTLNSTQPMNVLSSAAFIIIGILILFKNPKKLINWVYAIFLMMVGAGTAYYHHKLTFLGQTIDFGGMNLVILIIPFYYFSFRHSFNAKIYFAASYLLLFILTVMELLWMPSIRRAIFTLIVIFICGIYLFDSQKIISPKSKKYFIWSFSIFAFGFIFWNLDTYKVWCNSQSWYQGHALWHITGAIAAYFLFKSLAFYQYKK